MLKKAKNLIIILFVLTAMSIAVNFALAQGADSLLWGGTQNEIGNTIGLGSEDPRVLAAKIIRVFIGFLGIIAVGLIVYAGFLWMTSEGDESQITKAKQVLKNAVIGLAIILLSFGIVTFILSKFLIATGVGGPGAGTSPPGAGIGFGALGSCTVESVYPEPNQEEVPRNTAIMVTFKEEVDPTTICNDAGGNNNGVCDAGEYIIPENVKIYKTAAGDACGSSCNGNVLEVNVATNDNKTFVFTPVKYLGSPSENIWYTIHLTNEIEKNDKSGINDGIFSTCSTDYLEWQFKVSNKVDLTPPQVKKGGVFPAPDNDQDEINVATDAVAADGSIGVLSQPNVYAASTVISVSKNPSTGSWNDATAVANNGNQENGILSVTILSDGLTAQLSKGSVLLGSSAFSGSSVFFSGYFTLTVGGDGKYAVGNSWNVNITAEQKADTLTVGGTIYVFGEDIAVGGTTAATVSNIIDALIKAKTKLFGSFVTSGDSISMSANVAGSAGNNIILSVSNTGAIKITPMSGGKDREVTTIINDKKDQPRNAAIQINFNEAVNPLTISGDAESLQNYIAVKCVGGDCSGSEFFNCGSNICVRGSFKVSNGYKTVEFISDNKCGVNGCGEDIYCLPENSNLRVDITAAALDSCAGANDCVPRTPYNNCVSGVCQNTDGVNYPLSQYPLSGIADVASNSLDGNRNKEANGPLSFYNENIGGVGGDNFQWSFYINGVIDLAPPEINFISPKYNDSGASLSDPVLISFSKIMMSDSLRTGSKTVSNGGNNVEHKLINIRNFKNKPIGYWVTKENIDKPPLDGYPDYTQARINHSMFSDTTSYRSQVGSGVKDIYQNCFKPSAGPNCAATDAFPSCCGETPTADSKCP